MGMQTFYCHAQSIGKFFNWWTKWLQCTFMDGDPLFVQYIDKPFSTSISSKWVSSSSFNIQIPGQSSHSAKWHLYRMWRIAHYLRQTVAVSGVYAGFFKEKFRMSEVSKPVLQVLQPLGQSWCYLLTIIYAGICRRMGSTKYEFLICCCLRL